MEAFVRVAEARSVTEAARQWGRSKAVVSKYITQLETHLAVKLLQRSTRAISLTEAGRMHYESCRQLLQSLTEAELAVQDAHAAPSGPLRVSAPSGFFGGPRSAVLSSFLSAHPNVSLSLDMSSRLVSVVEEQVDVAVRVTKPADSELIARKLAPTGLIVVASPTYLQQEGTPRSPGGLRRHRCLIDRSCSFGAKWPLRHRGRVTVVEVRGPVCANEPFVLRELATDGVGIALLPELLVLEDVEAGRLRRVPVGVAATDWAVYAVTSHRRHLSARVRLFIDHLMNTLPDVLPHGET